MNILSEDISRMNNTKQKLGELLNEDFNLKEESIKVSLLNVDSSYRNNKPKNIVDSNTTILPNNPIQTFKGSSTIKINYPNHNLSEGDNIVIKNVTSIKKTLSNSFFLFNKLNYLIIKLEHNIPTDYKDYIEEISININLLSKLNSDLDETSRFYDNIPINMLLGVKKINTLQDVLELYSNSNINLLDTLYEKIYARFKEIKTEQDIYDNFIFIELDFTYASNLTELYSISHLYEIYFLQLNGIDVNKINSDYPIDHERQQGLLEVKETDSDNIWVTVNATAYSNGILGGSKINIFKILNTISGYPNAGEFTINLRKNFTNVVRIEMVSSEFPFTEFIIKDKGNLTTYTNYEDIPKVFDHVIKFAPEVPEPPHTEEQHEEMDKWNDRLQTLMEKSYRKRLALN